MEAFFGASFFTSLRSAGAVAGVLASLLAAGCARGPSKEESHWFAMDTDFSATVYLGKDRPAADPERAFALLQAECRRLEGIFSDYLPGSSLRRLQGNAGDTLMPDAEIYEVFRAAEEMESASRGAFDITLHALKSVWGLSSGDSARIPSDSAIAWAMRGNPAFHAPSAGNPALRPPFALLEDGRMVLLRDSVVFDLGGIAKGYAVDRMHAILDSLGYPIHIVKAGGDMRVGGSKGKDPWRLGIRHPRSGAELAGTLRLDRATAVSTSGDYERFFIRNGVRYHHVFDPRTGRPAGPYSSVTVLAENSLLADRLTKPLFILGPAVGADLLRRFGAQAVWMRESGVEVGAAAGGAGAVNVPGGDSTGAPLCHVASPGMPGILEMKDIPACPAGN